MGVHLSTTVATKLKIQMFIAMALMGAIGAAGLIGGSRSNDRLDHLVHANEALRFSLLLDMNHDGIRGDAYCGLFAEDPALLSETLAGMNDRIEELGTLHQEIARATGLEDREATDPLVRAYEATKAPLEGYLSAGRQFVAKLEEGKEAAKADLVNFERAFNALVDPMEAMSAAIQSDSEQASEDARGTAAVARTSIWGFLGLALVTLFVVGHRIGRGLLVAIDSMQRVLSAMADKRFDVRAEVKGQDELAEMATMVNRTNESIAQALREIVQSSRFLDDANASLAAIAHRVDSAATDTSKRASDCASTTVEMNQSCERSAAGAEEMRVSIAEIASQCESAASSTENVVKAASEARETMIELVRKSDEIGEIVRFISSIAEQTNLLALNATIESARAGESGRGFAVVAHEVKNLANETGKSTNVVREKVAAIQDHTKRAGDLIERIDDVIRQMQSIQSSIASAVQQQSMTTAEMARGMAQVSNGSSSIKSTVDAVASQAEVARRSSMDVGAANQRLNEITERLRAVVSSFKV